MKGIDFNTILQYYAMMCLILSPLSVAVCVFLYRKTDIIDRIDRFVDKLLGIKPEKKTDDKEKDAADSDENDAMAGIACFNLLVGDTYFCRNTSEDPDRNLHESEWSCDNSFLGRLTPEGKLQSMKTGTIRIFCKRKHDDFDVPRHAYSINILPKDTEWPVQRIIDAVNNRTTKGDVLARNIKKNITDIRDQQGIISYIPGRKKNSEIYQFDRNGKLERAVMVMYNINKDGDIRDDAALEERFEKVGLKNDDIQIWIHRIVDESKDEVDVFCVVRNLRDGGKAFCVSHTWREAGEIEEFLENIRMSVRLFEKCLPGEKTVEPVLSEDIKTSSGKEITVPESSSGEERGQETTETFQQKPDENTSGQEENQDGTQADDLLQNEETAVQADENLDGQATDETDFVTGDNFDDIEDFNE